MPFKLQAPSLCYLDGCKVNLIALPSQYSQYPNLPLPNSTYLMIYATFCRVADLSNATEYIVKKISDDLEQDLELK